MAVQRRSEPGDVTGMGRGSCFRTLAAEAKTTQGWGTAEIVTPKCLFACYPVPFIAMNRG